MSDNNLLFPYYHIIITLELSGIICTGKMCYLTVIENPSVKLKITANVIPYLESCILVDMFFKGG